MLIIIKLVGLKAIKLFKFKVINHFLQCTSAEWVKVEQVRVVNEWYHRLISISINLCIVNEVRVTFKPFEDMKNIFSCHLSIEDLRRICDCGALERLFYIINYLNILFYADIKLLPCNVNAIWKLLSLYICALPCIWNNDLFIYFFTWW